MKDKCVVVTGGAGFIGSGVVRALNDRGIHNIIIFDNLGRSEKWKNLVGKRFSQIFHKESCFDWLIGKEREIAAIIHLGACSSTLETDANYLLENNTHFSIKLADFALKHGIRFIYASSAATYGDGQRGFSDAHDSLENYAPLNIYGYSKHLFDLWLKNEGYLDRVVGLKYFNVYGPNEYHKGRMASAILKMVPDALNQGKISLFKSSEPSKYPDGGQIRDFIYVKDAAQMTIQFLDNDLAGIFNVGTGQEQSWKELAEAVIAALNLPVTVEYCDMPTELAGKYQNYTKADMGKWGGHPLLCDYRPTYSLKTAVADYIQNYLLDHKYW